MRKLLILLFLLINLSASELQDEIKDFLFDWDRAHNSKNFDLFNSLYSDKVNYYRNENENKSYIISDKKKLLKKTQDFNQRSELIKFEDDILGIKVYYDKHTYYSDKKRTFSSYLIIAKNNGTFNILEENDYKKDTNTNNQDASSIENKKSSSVNNSTTITEEKNSSSNETKSSATKTTQISEKDIFENKVKRMCSDTLTLYGFDCPANLFRTAIKNGCDKLYKENLPPAGEIAITFFDADPYLNEKECYWFIGELTDRIDKTTAIFVDEHYKYIKVENLPDGRYSEGDEYFGIVEGNGKGKYSFIGTIPKGNAKVMQVK